MRAALILSLIVIFAAGGSGYYMLWRKLDALEHDVDRVSRDYASAAKVERALDHLQGQINALRVSASAGPGPNLGGDATGHRIELFVNAQGQQALALRYAGPSFKAALEQERNTAGPSAALARAVKVDPQNPRLGTVDFTSMNRSTANSSSSGGNPGMLAVVRPDAQSVDWELTADSREFLKQQIGAR